MVKVLSVLVLLSLLFSLCSCGNISLHPEEETNPSPEITQPEETPVEDETPADDAPLHSPLYIEGLDVEDVIRYFNEVCLDAEIQYSGNASLVQKWTTPILYYLDGNPTDADMATLNHFIDWLSTVDGLPAFHNVQDPLKANLQIHFCTQDDMLAIMGDNYVNMDGAVTFWYWDNAIYEATICYRTDLDQTLRNSVILEEIYNGLGPVQDTDLRPDSIIYSEFTHSQELTEIDELILRLLYHPDIECGMNAAQCEAVIRQLYY